AVAQRSRLRIRPRAVEHDVSFLGRFLIVLAAHQQNERVLPPPGIVGKFVLQQTAPADFQDGRLRANVFAEQRRLGERFEVNLQMLSSGENVVVGRRLLPRSLDAKASASQWGAVHAERTEEADVAPALQVLADASALEEGEGQLERGGLQGGFQADRPTAEDGEPREIAAHHIAFPAAIGYRPIAPRPPRPPLTDNPPPPTPPHHL